MLKDFFAGFDVMDLAIILALGYLLITTTLGFVEQSMVENAVEWIGLIIAYLLGKKTPNTIGK